MTPPRWLAVILWWIACFIAAIWLALLLSGCAPYWVKDTEPVPIKGVVKVASTLPYCRQDRLGCFFDGVVYVRRDLSAEMADCVQTHEVRHANGWSHDPSPAFFLDCGDGTIFTEAMK